MYLLYRSNLAQYCFVLVRHWLQHVAWEQVLVYRYGGELTTKPLWSHIEKYKYTSHQAKYYNTILGWDTSNI